MPKNTHGGSKHKSQARKSFNTSNNLVIEPSSPNEKYAKVTKMFGNGWKTAALILFYQCFMFFSPLFKNTYHSS